MKSTPELQEALLEIFLRAMSIFRSAGKLGVLLLQLSPAFSPRKHRLNELEPLIEMWAATIWRLSFETGIGQSAIN